MLADPALLPFASLVDQPNPEQWLTEIAQRLRQLESEQERQQVSSYVQLLVGLKFDKGLIRQIFQEGIMRESVIYQEIFQEGERKGLQERNARVAREGRQEEAIALTLRLLKRRFGELDPDLVDQVRALAVE